MSSKSKIFGSRDEDKDPPAHDAQTAEPIVAEPAALSDAERLTQLRAWAARCQLGGPTSAAWEEFHKIAGE